MSQSLSLPVQSPLPFEAEHPLVLQSLQNRFFRSVESKLPVGALTSVSTSSRRISHHQRADHACGTCGTGCTGCGTCTCAVTLNALGAGALAALLLLLLLLLPPPPPPPPLPLLLPPTPPPSLPATAAEPIMQELRPNELGGARLCSTSRT